MERLQQVKHVILLPPSHSPSVMIIPARQVMPPPLPLCGRSVLEYDFLNLEIPTINVVGSLVRAGIPVLVYRYRLLRILLPSSHWRGRLVSLWIFLSLFSRSSSAAEIKTRSFR